jgi:hypothetical protein
MEALVELAERSVLPGVDVYMWCSSRLLLETLSRKMYSRGTHGGDNKV